MPSASYKRVFQVGTQQRSMEMNRIACEFVRSGGIGKVTLVQGMNYTGPRRYQGLPEQPIPAGLNWDAWIGQTEMRPYNQALQFGWMRWWDYSGGEMTNWGAHGLDQIQWALGMDDTGPVEFWPLEPIRRDMNGKVAFRYANGITVRMELVETGPQGGGIFVGEKGKIEINRNKFTTNPKDIIKNLAAPGRHRQVGRRAGTLDRPVPPAELAGLHPDPPETRSPTWRSATARSASATWPTSPASSAASSNGTRPKSNSSATTRRTSWSAVRGARDTSCRRWFDDPNSV